jgi:ketosteroid isomerase-like protein
MNLRLPSLPFRLLVLAAFLPRVASASESADETTLRRLNDDYVRAFLACDVNRDRELLADDFYGVLADGRVIDKAEFLRQAAQPPALSNFAVRDVAVRVYGDAAVVDTLATYLRPDGNRAKTRYVHVYVRQAGRWRIVSVQITRVTGP